MKLTINQFLQKSLDELNKGNFQEAEKCYRTILKVQPKNIEAHYNLAVTLINSKKFNEGINSYQNAIKFKPDFIEAHYNLAVTLINSKKFNEGINSYHNAIKFKPDFIEAHNNLGNVLHGLKRLNEAKTSYQNAIKFKPDFAEAHNNLGNIYLDLGELNKAELSYKKALSLKQGYIKTKNNIKLISSLKKLMLNIEKEKISNSTNLSIINPVMNLSPDPFITNRSVESYLINYLHKIKSRKLDETKDARFGNGKCSTDFYLFDDSEDIIKLLEKDLVNIMSQAVGSKIHVLDSFFNIMGVGDGTKPHNHITPFDKTTSLSNQKYSLVYYLSVGDQSSSDPGILKLYDPNKEILPIEGMIVIIPANRKHSAIYNGKKDRIMIGSNFYSL
ncbi:tetratricopeptide repeat protein [Candidatus Pelagibacter sp.]|nr:tetratricopeptide repeat protein [Candidatus Pelagibacter sp.]